MALVSHCHEYFVGNKLFHAVHRHVRCPTWHATCSLWCSGRGHLVLRVMKTSSSNKCLLWEYYRCIAIATFICIVSIKACMMEFDFSRRLFLTPQSLSATPSTSQSTGHSANVLGEHWEDDTSHESLVRNAGWRMRVWTSVLWGVCYG